MPNRAVHLIQRLLVLLATLVAASLVIFIVLDVLPGSAAEMLLGVDADPQAVAALARELGLDTPAWQRYLGWIGGLLTGDLGNSYVHATPVAELIGARLAVTVPLAFMAMTLCVVLSITLGLFAVRHHGRLPDTGVMLLAQAGLAIPGFWLAMLMIVVFAVQLQWVPAGGFPGWTSTSGSGGGLWPAFKALLLPGMALAVAQTAVLTRMVRSAALEVMADDFVRTARAKGLSHRAVLWRHVLRNAMLPVITVIGLQFATLLAGAIVVENVFYLPGLGRLMLQSIANRDLIVVRNCIMLLAALVMVVNFAADWLCTVVDPRLQPRRR